jgi:hypothetical protein
MDCKAEESWFVSHHRQEIFLFFTASVLALNPSSLLFSGQYDLLFRDKKLWRKAHNSPINNGQVKKCGAITLLPIRLHGVLLNGRIRGGATLHFI